jgi:hypothetical protein
MPTIKPRLPHLLHRHDRNIFTGGLDGQLCRWSVVVVPTPTYPVFWQFVLSLGLGLRK